ncbi:hypothetical protein SNEBB_005432 [Seison nebaliae]|nr:hypothetical protein SNEBB_005432 [Seison nebaliae]
MKLFLVLLLVNLSFSINLDVDDDDLNQLVRTLIGSQSKHELQVRNVDDTYKQMIKTMNKVLAMKRKNERPKPKPTRKPTIRRRRPTRPTRRPSRPTQKPKECDFACKLMKLVGGILG